MSSDKIGVYICQCGGNISDHVDVDEVVAAVEECREIPEVWREAEYAAWQAGTKGWAKPENVDISISA